MGDWVRERGGGGTHFRAKWGIKRNAGMNRNAGNVMRLKNPKTTKKANNADAKGDVRCCKPVSQCTSHPVHTFHAYFISAPGNPTLSSTILCISTKLHATKIVSNEFENVCAWNVHVTYDEATNSITRLRCRGFPTSSWIAQSSSTKLSRNMSTRSVQKTTAGVTSPPCPLPIHIHFNNSIGKP